MPFLRVLLLLLPSLAMATTITNGSFELDPCAGFFCTTTTLSGWTVTAGNVDLINNFWQNAAGTKSIDLAGTAPGTIQQNLSTVSGTTYRVSFFLAGNYAGAPTVKTVRVNVGATQQDYTFNTTGRSQNNMGWTLKTFDFTAAGATSSLRFQSLTTGVYGPTLDNVSIQEVPVVSIPEPGSLALLAAGGLFLPFLRRRRSR